MALTKAFQAVLAIFMPVAALGPFSSIVNNLERMKKFKNKNKINICSLFSFESFVKKKETNITKQKKKKELSCPYTLAELSKSTPFQNPGEYYTA